MTASCFCQMLKNRRSPSLNMSLRTRSSPARWHQRIPRSSWLRAETGLAEGLEFLCARYLSPLIPVLPLLSYERVIYTQHLPKY
jgi:hypothetical protein